MEEDKDNDVIGGLTRDIDCHLNPQIICNNDKKSKKLVILLIYVFFTTTCSERFDVVTMT